MHGLIFHGQVQLRARGAAFPKPTSSQEMSARGGGGDIKAHVPGPRPPPRPSPSPSETHFCSGTTLERSKRSSTGQQRDWRGFFCCCLNAKVQAPPFFPSLAWQSPV